MKYYGAPWSNSLIIISLVTSLICIIALFYLTISGNSFYSWPNILIIFIMSFCSFYTIRGYTLTDNAIFVHRLLWSSKISLKGLESAQYEPDAMRSSIRLFGNGGLFSFTGIFRNKKFGMYRAYVTDQRRTVVLYFHKSIVVISPDDPNEFIDRISVIFR